MENNKISGEKVASVTSTHSDILRYDINYESGNKMADIRRTVYHAGFACLYNKVKQGRKSFKLDDFFQGLESNYSGIVSRDGFGNRPSNLCIPALGGGDIPIRDFSCQSGGKAYVHQDGSWKQTADYKGYILLYYQDSKVKTQYGMKAFSFTIPRSSEEKVLKSYKQ